MKSLANRILEIKSPTTQQKDSTEIKGDVETQQVKKKNLILHSEIRLVSASYFKM